MTSFHYYLSDLESAMFDIEEAERKISEAHQQLVLEESGNYLPDRLERLKNHQYSIVGLIRAAKDMTADTHVCQSNEIRKAVREYDAAVELVYEKRDNYLKCVRSELQNLKEDMRISRNEKVLLASRYRNSLDSMIKELCFKLGETRKAMGITRDMVSIGGDEGDEK